MSPAEIGRFLRHLWLTLFPAPRVRVARPPGATACQGLDWHFSSAAPWPEYPAPHVCGACGWITCPGCMKAGVDCGVCWHSPP